jgi:hypothetical protein
LEKVLQKWGKDAEGEVVLGEIRREIRYALADDALEQVIERAFDLPPTDTEEGSKALKDLLEKILPLQIHFTDYVLGLFYAIQRVYPDMIKIVEEG